MYVCMYICMYAPSSNAVCIYIHSHITVCMYVISHTTVCIYAPSHTALDSHSSDWMVLWSHMNRDSRSQFQSGLTDTIHRHGLQPVLELTQTQSCPYSDPATGYWLSELRTGAVRRNDLIQTQLLSDSGLSPELAESGTVFPCSWV